MPWPTAGGSTESVLGIGTDLVDIDRMRRVLARTPGIKERLFTSAERAYAESSADPARLYAARFAAKEATLKSLGLGLGAMRFGEIEVTRSTDGRPELVLRSSAEAVATRHGVASFLITLSHTDTLASAVVVAL